jgi:hypothetical protein
MTIAITCSCSARLEVDDRFAGQTITCPDCQKSLDVPAGKEGETRRTSALALASLILALVGAFTLIGTVLAVVCGVAALLTIRHDTKRLAGRRYALAGLILGAVLTVLSLFAFSSTELFGVDSLLHESQWLGKLDYPPDLEVKREALGFKIRRPSAHWGVYQASESGPAVKMAIQDLLLVLPSKSAYIIVMTDSAAAGLDFDVCQERGIQLFRDLEITKFSIKRNPNLQVELERGNKKLWNKEENGKKVHYMEMTVHKTSHGQTKTFLLRVVKRDDDQPFALNRMYVVAGGAPAARFASLKKELTEALDSFQLLD